MRRDLLIGLVISLLVHAGLGWGDRLFASKPATPPPPADTVRIIEVALPPPDEPEPAAPGDASPELTDLAPPTLAELPSVSITTPFVQAIQPPPPPTLGRPAALLTIPVGRPGTALGKGMGELFAMADLDQPPTTRFNATYVYPYEMRRAGLTGEVEVGFIIDTEGNARDAYVIRSSQREFESAAIDFVLKSKYNPCKKDGRVVNVRASRIIKSNLDGNP